MDAATTQSTAPATSVASRWDRAVPQDPIDWARGVRAPWGVGVTSAQVREAIAVSGQRISVTETPFPSSHLYAPDDGKAHPAVMMLGGSEGGSAGFTDFAAAQWAMRGFTVLSYAYWGAPGTPPELANISLDDARRAAGWLGEQPQSASGPVGLYGVSRGAEMALLLAAGDPKAETFGAVATHAATNRTVGPFGIQQDGTIVTPSDPAGRTRAAWTSGGQDVATGAPIPAERYSGPVLMTHGTEDELWSVENTRALERRMRHRGRSPEVVYLTGQGHGPDWYLIDALDARRQQFFGRHLGRRPVAPQGTHD